MSSSNSVAIYSVRETTYNVMPLGATWDDLRYTSESLSATPELLENDEIREDRLREKRSQTNLASGGTITGRMSALTYDSFMEAAMCDTWTVTPTSDITSTGPNSSLDVSTKIITSATATFVADGLKAGMEVDLTGFSNSANNKTVILAAVTETTLKLVSIKGMVDESSVSLVVDWTSPTTRQVLTVGKQDYSYSLWKLFTDITASAGSNQQLVMTGQRVASMNVTYTFGDYSVMSFTFAGADALSTTDAHDSGATIGNRTTTRVFSPATDLLYLKVNGEILAGTCIRSINLTLDNNVRIQNCLGSPFPRDIDKGSASVSAELEIRMSANAYQLYRDTLAVSEVSVEFQVRDIDGYSYTFEIPGGTLEGEAPMSEGIDTDVMYRPTLVAHEKDGTHLRIIKDVA